MATTFYTLYITKYSKQLIQNQFSLTSIIEFTIESTEIK